MKCVGKEVHENCTIIDYYFFEEISAKNLGDFYELEFYCDKKKRTVSKQVEMS